MTFFPQNLEFCLFKQAHLKKNQNTSSYVKSLSKTLLMRPMTML